LEHIVLILFIENHLTSSRKSNGAFDN